MHMKSALALVVLSLSMTSPALANPIGGHRSRRHARMTLTVCALMIFPTRHW